MGRSWIVAAAVAAGAVGATAAAPGQAAAQETGLRGGIAVSRFTETRTTPTTLGNEFDDRLTATGFGGYIRFRFGPIALQPEVMIVTRGGKVSEREAGIEEEQLRLDYLELPVLLALPFQVGRFEPVLFGGGMIALETRCRLMTRQSGLRSNIGCDSPTSTDAFERNAFDYGLITGASVSHPVGTGRVFVEARHTWGLRNIVSENIGFELRHRTFLAALGYAMTWDPGGR